MGGIRQDTMQEAVSLSAQTLLFTVFLGTNSKLSLISVSQVSGTFELELFCYNILFFISIYIIILLTEKGIKNHNRLKFLLISWIINRLQNYIIITNREKGLVK